MKQIKKQMLAISMLVFIFTHTKIFSKLGITVLNKSDKLIRARIDHMKPGKYIKSLIDGWALVGTGKKNQTFLPTSKGGKRVIYWNIDNKYYKTPAYKKPIKIIIKKGGEFSIQTGTALVPFKKGTATEIIKSKIELLEKSIKKEKAIKTKEENEKPEKIQGVSKKILNTLKATPAALEVAKLTYKLLGNSAEVSNVLLKETEKIKAKAKQISTKKQISEKIALLQSIMRENLITLFQSGVKPLMKNTAKILNNVGQKIVGLYNPEIGKVITYVANDINNLIQPKTYIIGKSKKKELQTISDYLYLIDKMLKTIAKSLKDTKKETLKSSLPIVKEILVIKDNITKEVKDMEKEVIQNFSQAIIKTSPQISNGIANIMDQVSSIRDIKVIGIPIFDIVGKLTKISPKVEILTKNIKGSAQNLKDAINLILKDVLKSPKKYTEAFEKAHEFLQPQPPETPAK
ncbi:hypothetical protein ACFLYU_02795 [Candidatus Dependentiae bacterium]